MHKIIKECIRIIIEPICKAKFYPVKKKVIAKVGNICKEILKLKSMKDDKTIAAQIERINSIITGAAEYYKVAICNNTYNYMDHRIKQ